MKRGQKGEKKEDPQTIPEESALKDKPKNMRVKVNVGGRLFETYTETLCKYPQTRLGAYAIVSEDPDHQFFFDRDPRIFEVILNYYRTGRLIVPEWMSLEALNEEMKYFSIQITAKDPVNKRISLDLLSLDYKERVFDSSEYKKISRHKLLAQHRATLIQVMEEASLGHSQCEILFHSPLHYTDFTPNQIFNVISKDEIRELIVELLEEKEFEVIPTSEYSKTKTTAIMGLADHVTNYNDPKSNLTSFVKKPVCNLEFQIGDYEDMLS